MKPLILIVPIGFLLASCSVKMEKEEVMPRSFKLSIEAEYPHEEATKVVFEGRDLAWEGSEKMDINIGNGTSATASEPINSRPMIKASASPRGCSCTA